MWFGHETEWFDQRWTIMNHAACWFQWQNELDLQTFTSDSMDLTNTEQHPPKMDSTSEICLILICQTCRFIQQQRGFDRTKCGLHQQGYWANWAKALPRYLPHGFVSKIGYPKIEKHENNIKSFSTLNIIWWSSQVLDNPKLHAKLFNICVDSLFSSFILVKSPFSHKKEVYFPYHHSITIIGKFTIL